MTTTSISSEPLSSSYLSSYTSGASLHSFARRHSIYGTEDRVVLDIGSLYIKCGFSGESHPRHIIPTWSRLKRSQSPEGEAFRIDAEPVELYDTVIYAPDARESTSFQDFEEKLKRLLHDIYFRHLLTDPKSRKVIICESPLTPIAVKQTIAKLLFQYFQVPSISFVPIHLMALMTTGKTTGLIVECGNLETTILPIYAARPLYPFIVSTPRAGRSLSKRLKELLLSHGRLIPPSHLHLSLAPQHPIPETVLTTELIEDLKTRVLFCSPILMSHDDSVDKIDAYKSFSSATDVYYPVMLKDGTKATLLIPGWIRERAADVLFEGDDEDEPGVAQCVLECLLKLQPDLRRPLISALLFNGGTAALPGFTSRLRQELMRIMREPTPYENRKYGALRRLQKDVRFIDNPEDIKTAGRIFCSSIRGWIGGSLIGSLKLSGEEIVREKYNGIVTDWSIGNWSSITNGVSNNSATSTTDSTMSYRTSQKDAFAH